MIFADRDATLTVPVGHQRVDGHDHRVVGSVAPPSSSHRRMMRRRIAGG